MIVCSRTDRGLVRKTNQDACQTGTFPDGAVWAVVCDGMGGANGGNIASAVAVEKIAESLTAGYHPEMDQTSIRELILGSIYEANTVVYDMAKKEEGLRGMGTTVVAAIVKGSAAYIAHAGDSRAYFVGSPGMRQLTTDHSMVQELVKHGDITQEEARNHPQRNIITRALGVTPKIEVDFGEYSMGFGEALLLCTDGLTNYTEEAEIETLFRSLHGDNLAEKLVELARRGGGGDNITVAIVVN